MGVGQELKWRLLPSIYAHYCTGFTSSTVVFDRKMGKESSLIVVTKLKVVIYIVLVTIVVVIAVFGLVVLAVITLVNVVNIINRDKLRPTFGTGLLQRGFPAECDLWLSELFEIICDVFCSHSNSGNCRRKGGWLPWLTSWVAIASLNCDRKVITQHNHTRRPVFGISS